LRATNADLTVVSRAKTSPELTRLPARERNRLYERHPSSKDRATMNW
jgi:hypothetical protein